MVRHASLPLLILTATMGIGCPAIAQISASDAMTQARAAEGRGDSAEALSRYLRVLATRPKDVDALTGAGKAAIDVGDPDAAVAFYARAEEIAPRNGRIKAGLGSALVQLNNPRAALRLFDDATDLGVAASELAGDRGLAYDLRGDNKRAQQDYQLALATREDSETRRRLALSLAMSKDRAGALAVLEPLLRRQDVPAWRVRAFVLALTGDPQGAENTALSVLPRPQALALLPYLTRLPTLKTAQQAAAVHLGRFPSEDRPATAMTGEALASAGSISARAAESVTRPTEPKAGRSLIPAGPALGTKAAQGGTSTAELGRPVSPATSRETARPSAAVGNGGASPPSSSLPTSRQPRLVKLPGTGLVIDLSEAYSLPESVPPTASSAAKSAAAKPSGVKTDAPVRIALNDAKAKPAGRGKAEEQADAKVASSTKAKESDPKAKRDAKAKDPDKAMSDARKDGDKRSADKKEETASSAKGKSGERYWVQVAGGANKADLPKAYARLKDKAPQLLAGRTAWTTPLRATNRLLVGPFKTLQDAQDFVNRAGKALSAFTYTSPAGQEIEKLSAK